MLTPQGQAAVDSIDAVLERFAMIAFAIWSKKVKKEFVRLIRKFVSGLSTKLPERSG